MNKHFDIAIVIPVFRDTEKCCSLINRIRNWPKQPAEIVVVSAEQNKVLLNFCADNNCQYTTAHECRGTQLDIGAKLTKAAVLWFLHADSVPDSKSLNIIETKCLNNYGSGHFKFRFTGERTWKKIFLESLIKFRILLGGIAYGDQGLFMQRQNYLDCGGFDNQPLFEEIRLVKNLRKKTQFQSLNTPIGVSPRRWIQGGWIKQSLKNRILVIRYLLGAQAEKLAHSYYMAPKAQNFTADQEPKK